MVNKPGRYGAKLLAWTVEASKSSGLPQFVVRFQIVAVYDGEKFQPETNEITGYFYPVKKDGTRNDNTCEMLMKVLGWDGRSFLGLHEGQHAGRKCQLEVKEETYEGKSKLKVAWLYPPDYAGSVFKRQEPAAVNALDAKWAKVLGGATPATQATPNAPAAPDFEDLSLDESDIPF